MKHLLNKRLVFALLALVMVLTSLLAQPSTIVHAQDFFCEQPIIEVPVADLLFGDCELVYDGSFGYMYVKNVHTGTWQYIGTYNWYPDISTYFVYNSNYPSLYLRIDLANNTYQYLPR